MARNVIYLVKCQTRLMRKSVYYDIFVENV